jgi:hypothetical protein
MEQAQALLERYQNIKNTPALTPYSQERLVRQAKQIRDQIERAGYILIESEIAGTCKLEPSKKGESHA